MVGVDGRLRNGEAAVVEETSKEDRGEDRGLMGNDDICEDLGCSFQRGPFYRANFQIIAQQGARDRESWCW